jgi:putative methyltransferase (TIGR04325 family)
MNLRDLFPSVSSIVNERTVDSKDAFEFESFDAALSASGGEGYAQAQIADVVLQKTILYRERLDSSSHPTLTANQARQILAISLSRSDNELSVLDLGGGCGVHYFLAKKLFGSELKLRWSVVETPEMIEKARSLESDELRFFTTIAAAVEAGAAYDLSFSSGALQYLPNPFEALKTLMGVGAKNLFLTRVALSVDDKDHIFIHESALNSHGRGEALATAPDGLTHCPVTMLAQKRLEQILTTQYDIVMAFSESTGAYRFGRHSFNQYGYHCRIRK